MKILAATLASILAVDIMSMAVVILPLLLSGAPMYWNQILFLSFWVTVVTSIVVVFIGIPAYLLLRRFNKATTLNLVMAGVVIPGVVFTIINFITGTSGSFGHTYHGTYRQMIVEGERTFWGWLSILEQGIIFCIYGAVAAATFGIVVGRKYSDSN